MLLATIISRKKFPRIIILHKLSPNWLNSMMKILVIKYFFETSPALRAADCLNHLNESDYFWRGTLLSLKALIEYRLNFLLSIYYFFSALSELFSEEICLVLTNLLVYDTPFSSWMLQFNNGLISFWKWSNIPRWKPLKVNMTPKLKLKFLYCK